MGLPELEFDIAVRDWAISDGLTLKPSSDHNKTIIQYVDGATLSKWNDNDIESAKTNIASNISNLAYRHNINYTIEFTDLGSGNLAAIIITKSELTRKDAACRYYDLLCLGYRMSTEQFKELQMLRKKFGFI